MGISHIQIDLNPEEMEIVRYIARARIAYNRTVGAKPDLEGYVDYDPEDQEKREINSFGSEFAYCKLFNLYPDLDTRHYSKFDAQHNNGDTVDIKTTVYETGHLVVKTFKGDIKHADYYALLIGEFPKYRYCGEMASAILITPARINYNRYNPPMYEASQQELILRSRAGKISYKPRHMMQEKKEFWE